MRDNGIQGAKRRGRPWRTTTPDPDAGRLPDLVGRDFTASEPGELVVADFTYVRCWEGLVFFAFCLDVFSRMLVGWLLAGHMRAELVVDALQMALGTRKHLGHVELVHHSDRGSQYTSADLHAVMAAGGVLASVGSTGDAYDNSTVPVTRTRASRCWWPNATSSTGATAGRHSRPGRTASD